MFLLVAGPRNPKTLFVYGPVEFIFYYYYFFNFMSLCHPVDFNWTFCFAVQTVKVQQKRVLLVTLERLNNDNNGVQFQYVCHVEDET